MKNISRRHAVLAITLAVEVCSFLTLIQWQFREIPVLQANAIYNPLSLPDDPYKRLLDKVRTGKVQPVRVRQTRKSETHPAAANTKTRCGDLGCASIRRP